MRRIIAMVLSVMMVLSVVGTLTIFSTVASAAGGAIYVTPAGAGSQDGSSWENAMAADVKNGLNEAWKKVPQGGTLYIGSGNYIETQSLNITAENGGQEGAFKYIEGVDTAGYFPTFFGPFTLADQSGTFLNFGKGASYVKVKNLIIKNYMYPVKTAGNSNELHFAYMDMYDMADGMYFSGGASASEPENKNTNIYVDNCNFTNLTKSSIRFNHGVDGALITNCFANAGGMDNWYKGNFPLGFHVYGDNNTGKNITYVNCTSMGAYERPDDTSTYWNGDGFCSEGNTENITYIRCRAYWNTDGGWDDKCPAVTLIDCVSANNKRNWRFWNDPVIINGFSAVPDHPDPEKGGQSGFWAGRFSRPKIYNSTFYNAGLGVELGGYEVYNSIFYSDNGSLIGAPTSGFAMGAEESLVWEGNISWDAKNQKGDADPELVDPHFEDNTNIRWDGMSDKFNSKKYGASKGYYYDAAAAPNRYLPTEEMTAAVDNKFVDVTNTYAWAADAISFMASSNFMPGMTVKAFVPSANMNRIQFTSMLVRSLGVTGSTDSTFDDMVYLTDKKRGWLDASYTQFADDIAIAKSAGITNGVDMPNGQVHFRPGLTITRQEMMVLVSRTLKTLGKIDANYAADLAVLNSYSDAANVAEWAKQDVANVIALGIIAGSDGMIDPLGTATRAQGAVVGKRIVDSYK